MNDDPQAALAWCPFPDTDTARSVTEQLLAEKLIACANIMPGVISVFEWQGQASSETEAVALLKSRAELLDRLITRLGELHPYDTPAIVGWVCDAAHPLTMEWLGETIGSRSA